MNTAISTSGKTLDIVPFSLTKADAAGSHIGSGMKVLSVNRKRILDFRAGSTYMYRAGQYDPPDYDLYEIDAAEDADGIIRRAIQKKRALSVKEGFQFTGLNNQTIEYIEQRFREIELAQDMSMELLIKNTLGDLVRYHNAFWVKVRDDSNSSGNKRRTRRQGSSKILEPVSAYFRLPAETMRVLKDKYGNVISWQQIMPDGRHREFSKENIVHFKHNARAGFTFAPPGLLPAIDDVRALRRIEENIELLIEEYLFPLFALSIGTDQWPAEVYPDGSTEIEQWTRKLDEMPVSGGLVVSHRHKFTTLGFDKILPVDGYVQHFLKRAYTSAGVSNIDMGDGQGMNRSTADNASKILMEDVKDYQQEFKWQFEMKIINELLLEKYNERVLLNRNRVSMQFAEIDIESMIKVENHSALMYSMSSYTEDEMRLGIKRKIIDSKSERSKLFVNRYEAEKIKIQTDAAIRLAKASAKVSAKTNSKDPNQKAQNLSKNKQQPTNQHVTLSAPTGKKSSLSNSELSKLKILSSDFYEKDRDSTKLGILSWLFSLDYTNLDNQVCITIYNDLLPLVDSLYEASYDKVGQYNNISSALEDTIIQKLNNYIGDNNAKSK